MWLFWHGSYKSIFHTQCIVKVIFGAVEQWLGAIAEASRSSNTQLARDLLAASYDLWAMKLLAIRALFKDDAAASAVSGGYLLRRKPAAVLLMTVCSLCRCGSC